MPTNGKNSANNTREQRSRGGRSRDKQRGGKIPELSESQMQRAAPLSSSPEAQVSFFITQAKKVQFRERGYSDDQIAEMKPADAHRILGLL